MRIVKATRQDWKWPAIFLLLGLLGAFVSVRYFRKAFPEASIDLKLTRDEIGQRATAWMRLRGLNPGRFRENIIFAPDEESKTYLERELPLDEANRLMSTQVGVWRWKVRRFNPPEKEEVRVYLDPAGELVSFEHLVDEKAPGARLGKEEAQRLAEIFLRTQKDVKLDDYTLVQDVLKERPNRYDYSFTWERKGFQIKDATFRMAITLQGDQVGEFREFLKIPEQWTRDYQRMRSRNTQLTLIATAFYVPLLVVAIVVLVQRARKKQIAWKAASLIGGLVGLVMALETVNEFPLAVADMASNTPYSTVFGMIIVGAILVGVILGLWVALTAAAGSPLYGEVAPSRLPLARLFTLSGLRTREFFFSTLTGYGMAAFHIGATVLFYLIARKFGAWSPLEIKYDNTLSTPLPWLAPLATSLFAATSEEFSFRFFAIPLLQRWLKSRWVALIIPAFIWGFLHSSYPQQPAWIRGVEVGLIGILAGWVMLRFGILATLVWHYTVDAVLIGLFLIRSDSLFYRISGVLVADAVLIPLVVCVVLYLQHRGFVEETEEERRAELQAAQQAEPAAAPAATPAAAYEVIPPHRLRAAALAAFAGLGVLALVKTPSVGDFVRFTAGRSQAEATARQELQKRGVNMERFRVVTITGQSAVPAVEYLRRQVGVKGTNRIYQDGRLRLAAWETRFFQPLRKEEYRVRMAPDGGEPCVIYIQDEKVPGASLSLDEARERAEEFLAGRGLATADYNLLESTLEKRPARNDYTFVWEARQPLAGEARERIRVQLIGDVISGPEHSVKVPEAWEREFSRMRITSFVTVLIFLVLGCIALGLFIKRLGQGPSRSRVYVLIGLAAALLVFFRGILGSPAWAAEYNTAVTWETAVMQQVSLLALAAMGTLAVGLLALMADTLLCREYGAVPLLPERNAGRAGYLRDALLGGTAGAFGYLGISRLTAAAAALIPAPRPIVTLSVGHGLDNLWPAGSALLSTATYALVLTPALGVGAALAFTWLRKPERIAGVAALFSAAIALAAALTPVGFALVFITQAVSFAAFGGLIWLLRRNASAYLVAFGWIAAVPDLTGLWRHPAYRVDAAVFAAMLLAAAGGLLLWWRNEYRRAVA